MSTEHDNDLDKCIKDKAPSLPAEFLAMLKQNKKFWLVPIIVALLLMGLLVMLGGTAAAPFIYTLF